jgi:hypothetical protein
MGELIASRLFEPLREVQMKKFDRARGNQANKSI